MNIAILIYHDVLDFEVSSAMTIFKTAARFTQTPLEVFTTHRTRASVLGASGLVMTPSYAISAAPTPDVLIIPGGAGIEKLVKDVITKEYLLANKNIQHLILGSNAAILLGEYGLLENRAVTVFPALLETIWKFNPSEVKAEPMVQDGNFTSISRSGQMLGACLAVLQATLGLADEVGGHLGLALFLSDQNRV